MHDESSLMFPTHDDIARRAYEKFLERGSLDGYDREDWLDAEQELLEQYHDQIITTDTADGQTSVEPTHAE